MSAEEHPPVLKAWVEALVSGFGDLATTILGVESFTVVGEREQAVGQLGGFISMVGEVRPVQLAIIADERVFRSLAATLLGMEPEEAEELSEADVSDGLGELINIVAGTVKTTMVQHDATIKLGLPFVVHGWVETGTNGTQVLTDVDCGGLPATLLVSCEKAA